MFVASKVRSEIYEGFQFSVKSAILTLLLDFNFKQYGNTFKYGEGGKKNEEKKQD